MAIKMHFLRISLLIAFIFLGISQTNAQDKITQYIVKNKINSKEQQKKPYVILISADGFRHDFIEKHNAINLKRLSEKGVRANSMSPSFPSLTFPNHYTLATGLLPQNHGIVNNNFYDKKLKVKYSPSDTSLVRNGNIYGGTPLWVLAEQQNMLSASYFWIGSEAAIKNIKPTYSYHYKKGTPLNERINTVLDWLNLPEDRRPHLITFYIDEPDASGHAFGPNAQTITNVVKQIDEEINRLTEAVKKTGLPVDFIFVSDHGLTEIDREAPINLSKELSQTGLYSVSTGFITNIFVDDLMDTTEIYNKFKNKGQYYKTYLKKDFINEFNFAGSNDADNRIGDIILVAEWPKVFASTTPSPGAHGYDPLKVKDMEATFLAWGPSFKEGIRINTFKNIHIYPLVAKLLGLQITDKIDGELKVLEPILKQNKE
ncbi:ectonucleotide pyrophosphatase/phosphodiesterase [Pedobacter flavus]|uniref:Ectonucleotide pyrophosphatase/phosphodiesterase n=1 Tax=Pedobacter flavus TaxID=3113906 RepID=A0ABU7H1D8_9SPHI|nr:ectonucleotide pyrophosphatase/phosphodiesterase [Pedobacter sp. VNH31]MEE1885146.1 ectonucleotide pyrophosphatase/phosphodiesterase [Pedobacter sp. VNH31]